jgi:hypothetical protein
MFVYETLSYLVIVNKLYFHFVRLLEFCSKGFLFSECLINKEVYFALQESNFIN